MKKRIVAFLLALAMLVGLVPQMMLAALAEELSDIYTLENDLSASRSRRRTAASPPGPSRATA